MRINDKLMYVSLILVILLIMIVPSMSNAEHMPKRTLSPEQMYLGGLTCGQTRDQVERIYGEPTKYSKSEYVYGNSLFITFEQYKDAKRIWRIVTNANNGISTPAGVEVGTKEHVLKRVYGEPSAVSSPTQRTDYCAIYWYRGYGEDTIKEFLFYVRDRKVIKIQFSVYD